jgi:hypothetical protein
LLSRPRSSRADKLERALEEARLRVEELEDEERARTKRDLIAGAGAVLGALFGGRRATRSITRAAERAAGGRRSRSTFNAQLRASRKQQELEELEQQILDEVAEIDARWREAAEGIDTLEVGLEAADVKAVHTALVWVRR